MGGTLYPLRVRTGKVEVQAALKGDIMKSLFKTMLLGAALAVPTASLADDETSGTSLSTEDSFKHRPWWRAVRFGACAGMSTDCLAGSLKFDVSPRYVGFSIGSLLIWGTATLKAFPLDYRHTDYVSWRPYAYMGGGYIIMSSGYSGYGVGADVLVGKSKRLLLQPSAGFNRVSWSGPEGGEAIEPAGQLSVMLAF